MFYPSVPETKFEGSEGERLGQLVVTPEVAGADPEGGGSKGSGPPLFLQH